MMVPETRQRLEAALSELQSYLVGTCWCWRGILGVHILRLYAVLIWWVLLADQGWGSSIWGWQQYCDLVARPPPPGFAKARRTVRLEARATCTRADQPLHALTLA